MFQSMALVFSILASFVVAWFIVTPLFGGNELLSSGDVLPHDALRDQKDRFVQMLRDLELDFATAKVSSSDYEQTKYELSLQLAEILKRLEVRDNA